MNKLKLLADIRVKEASNDKLVIEGYANTTTKDRVSDVVLEEAWTKGGMDNYLKNPIVLAFHNHQKPIGKVVDHSINKNGLRVVAEISKAAGEVYSLIKEGILKTFSVSFIPKDAEYDNLTDIFVIKDLELLEISVVSVPANADAVFSVKKSLEKDEYEAFKKQVTEKSADVKTEEGLEEIVEKKVFEILENTIEKSNSQKEKEENIMTESVTGAEKLLEEITKRLESVEKQNQELLKEKEAALAKNEQEKAEAKAEEEAAKAKELETLLKSVEDLKSEIKANKEELEAIQASKMKFVDKGEPVSPELIDKAVFASKILGRSLDKTLLGQQIIEKLGSHFDPANNAGWEEQFSARMWDDVKLQLVVEPLFESVPMTAASMVVPVNPESGYGEWIQTSAYRTATSSGTSSMDHQIKDQTLTAYKVAAKEYLGLEEEEDAIIPLLPVLRNSLVRTIGKTVDRALLRGAGNGTTDPITGLETYATTDSKVASGPSISGGGLVTLADLHAARKLLGDWGLDPNQVAYVVSTDAYYDLLEDPDFRTLDMVGQSNATILNGQISSVLGSPVLVSGEFNTKASGNACVMAVNTRNFLMGVLRTLSVERERKVEEQRNTIVATRRIAFTQLITGNGVAAVDWQA